MGVVHNGMCVLAKILEPSELALVAIQEVSQLTVLCIFRLDVGCLCTTHAIAVLHGQVCTIEREVVAQVVVTCHLGC